MKLVEKILKELICDHEWSYGFNGPIQPGEGFIPVECKKCGSKRSNLVKYVYSPAGMSIDLNGKIWAFAEPTPASIKWTMEWPNVGLKELNETN